MSYNGDAKIWLENHTDKHLIAEVLHQYTDRDIQRSSWKLIKAGESTHMLDVTYRYGFFTSGVDNWKLTGMTPSGEFWRAGHSFAADWMKHMLSSTDDGRQTTIKVYPSCVQFCSQSGNSETQWFMDTGRGSFEPWSSEFDVAKMVTGMVVDVAKLAKKKKEQYFLAKMFEY